MFYSYKQCEASLPCFTMSIYSGDVVSKDVLKSFRNLLEDEDETSVKKLDEDLDILWASKGGNVDLSKWLKDDFQHWFHS